MTIKELAKLAGVSISTVSKVMNHKDESIIPETRDRVLRIAKEFNYVPYSKTYALTPSTKTNTIGVLVRSAETSRELHGIIKAARSLGYTTLVSECGCDPELEFSGITSFCRFGVDGVLWEPLNEDSLTYAESFRAAEIPFLLFNYDFSDTAINIDFEQMGYSATMELIRAQHTEIACLLSPGTRTERFLNGYRRCLFDAGIPYQETMVYREVSDSLIHKITSHTVTGIASSHFAAANRLFGELSAHHYQIPDDVSLISLRNDSDEYRSFPEISTYTTPHLSFGRHLCEQLIACMKDHDHVPLPFEFRPLLDNRTTISIPLSKRNKPILVIGSINMDHYLKMERLPSTGKSTVTSSSAAYPGGKGFNQAVGIAKLGENPILIGAVGSDMDSDLIYEALEEYSMRSGGVRRCADTSTGKAYIFVQRDGDSLISVLSGANDQLTLDDIKRNIRHFENSSYCLISTEIPMDVVAAACKQAKECGVSTILKPAACNKLPEELLPYIDILIPNHDEISLLCPEGDLSQKADYYLSHGISTVIVTLGADGCYLKTMSLEEYIPAVPFQTIDNTGACDAFISALAVYLQRGCSMKNAVHIATYAAGFSITREGVSNALIDRSTLESYIYQKEPDLFAH